MIQLIKRSFQKRIYLMVGILIVVLIPTGNTLGQEMNQDRQAEITENQFLFEYIYFKKDSTEMVPSSKATLASKINWLMNHPEHSIMIEGHCDNRGSDLFNLRLGDARAGKVKTMLIKAGISASRLLTISYGEEDPVDTGKNEEAWSKNRRVRLVIN